LRQATAEKDGQDVEVLGHLGEVLEALGEIDEAKDIYRQAVEAAGPTKREQERKAAIEEKLLTLGD
jgi:hypothetical protein